MPKATLEQLDKRLKAIESKLKPHRTTTTKTVFIRDNTYKRIDRRGCGCLRSKLRMLLFKRPIKFTGHPIEIALSEVGDDALCLRYYVDLCQYCGRLFSPRIESGHYKVEKVPATVQAAIGGISYGVCTTTSVLDENGPCVSLGTRLMEGGKSKRQ